MTIKPTPPDNDDDARCKMAHTTPGGLGDANGNFGKMHRRERTEEKYVIIRTVALLASFLISGICIGAVLF